jgi:lysophospholipase L1-like esterase
MRFREAAARGLLLLAGSLGGVGLAEVTLRLPQSRVDPRDYVAFRKSSTPGLDYEFIPSARVPWGDREIRTNRQGFRGPDFAVVGDVWPRIAVMGDSVAAGYGVAEEEAFPYRMAALMRERGLRGEVLDFGVPGYNIQRIALLWEEKVRLYRPDAVVYALCLNDARPELTLSPEGVLVAAGTVELSPERARPGRVPLPGKDWLRQHSRLYGFAVSRYDLLLRRLGFRAEPSPPLDQIARLYTTSLEGRRFRAVLGRLAASVQSSGARFAVVCFPLGEQLRNHDARAQAALSSLAGRLGVDFVDLYPAFLTESGGRPEALLAADGLHPNAAGHALAARETLGVLRSWIEGGAGTVRPLSESRAPQRGGSGAISSP